MKTLANFPQPGQNVSDPRPIPRLVATVLAGMLALGSLVVGPGIASASAGKSGGIGPPGDSSAQPVDPNPSDPSAKSKREAIKRIARREVKRRPFENGGDNVPRYRKGKGRVAPYGFQRGRYGPWCAAFATWTWGRAGFDEFRSGPKNRTAQLLRPSFSGEQVAVQVADLRSWARQTDRLTKYATPGDLVGYEDDHVGIVMKVNRDKRAILAIEGNKTDRVRWFRIPMSAVIDYFSPTVVSKAERSSRRLMRPDVG